MIKKVGIYPLILSIIIIIFYYPILWKFFEQDEWHNFGVQIYRYYEGGALGLFKNILISSLPLTQIYNTINFLFFGVNNLFPALTVLVLVAVNSFLWYQNVIKITGSKAVGAFSVIFGYINLISFQSVTWVIPAVASQLSFLLINISLYYFLAFLDKQTKKKLIIVLMASILAVFSKQNSIFILLFYPIVFFTYEYKKFSKDKTTKIVIGLLSFLFLSGILYWNKMGGIRFGEGRVTADWFQLFLNIFFLPLKSMSQLIFPFPDYFYKFTSYILSVRYGLGFGDPVSQGLLIELISTIISLVLIITIVLIWKIFKKKEKRGMLFFGLFYFLSFLPFTIDKYSTGTGYSESRYYQLGVISLGVVIGIILFRLLRMFWQSKLILSKIIFVFLLLFFLLSFAYQISAIQKVLHLSVEVTQKRREILQYMSSKVNKNSETLILYTQNINHTGTDNITGEYFQTGVLYPFLVYTYKNNYVSPLFFSDDKLWDFTFQGIETKDDKTVGIFYSYSDFKNFIVKHPQFIDNILAIQFDYSNVGKVPSNYNFYDLRIVKYSDITQEILNKLQ